MAGGNGVPQARLYVPLALLVFAINPLGELGKFVLNRNELPGLFRRPVPSALAAEPTSRRRPPPLRRRFRPELLFLGGPDFGQFFLQLVEVHVAFRDTPRPGSRLRSEAPGARQRV